MFKRFAVSVTALLTVFILAATAAQAKTVFRIAHTLAPTSHYNKGLLHLDELIKSKSNGELLLDIYPAAQLGSEEDAISGVEQGMIEMTLVSTAPLMKKTKAFMLFDLPFIIFDREKAEKWMDGPEGKKILDAASTKNTLAMSFWEDGFHHITNSRQPVNTPEDIKDMTIRTMDNPLNLATFKTLQAVPMPISFGEELFKALQEKTVDGQENPLEVIFTSNFFEVQKFLTLTGHYYSPAILLVNKPAWDKLSEANRAIMIESINQARDWERGYSREMDANLVEELKAKGMEVVTPEKEAWVKAMEPVYAEFGEQIGKELIDSLLGTQNGTIPLPSTEETPQDESAKTQGSEAAKQDAAEAKKEEAAKSEAEGAEKDGAASPESGDAAKPEEKADDSKKEDAQKEDAAKPKAGETKPDADDAKPKAGETKPDADDAKKEKPEDAPQKTDKAA